MLVGVLDSSRRPPDTLTALVHFPSGVSSLEATRRLPIRLAACSAQRTWLGVPEPPPASAFLAEEFQRVRLEALEDLVQPRHPLLEPGQAAPAADRLDALGPKLTNRLRSSMSRSSIAAAVSPCAELQSANSDQRRTNSSSSSGLTIHVVEL